jgi:hypothetical protein
MHKNEIINEFIKILELENNNIATDGIFLFLFKSILILNNIT